MLCIAPYAISLVRAAEATCAVRARDIDVTPTAVAPALTSRAFLKNVRLLVSRIAADSSPVISHILLRPDQRRAVTHRRQPHVPFHFAADYTPKGFTKGNTRGTFEGK